jgi:xanthine/CO dehydrogenase XdhC/CoxF family maturation factor
MITPFDGEDKRVTAETARTRNAMMLDLADEIVIGYVSEGGMLEQHLAENKEKPLITLWSK